MAFSGVRNSCDSVARNSSFRRFASFAPPVGERILDGERGAGRHILAEGEVPIGVVPARVCVHERHRAERAGCRQQRHAHVRRRHEVDRDPQMLRVERVPGRLVGQNGGHHHRLASADHLVHAARRIGIDGKRLPEDAGICDLGLIDGRDRQPLQLARSIDEIHRAPVRNLRDGQPRDGGEGRS